MTDMLSVKAIFAIFVVLNMLFDNIIDGGKLYIDFFSSKGGKVGILKVECDSTLTTFQHFIIEGN